MLAGVSVATAAGPANSLKRQANTLESRTHRALLDLYALDSRLHAAEARLSSLAQQSQRVRNQQALLARQISATSRTLAVSQQELGQNLSTLYKRGDVSALAVVLGAESLDDALSSVTDESERVVAVTGAARTRLTTLRGSLQERRAELDAAVADAQRTADALASARSERVGFISKLRSEQRLKRSQITALQAAAQRVERKSNELQAAAASADATPQPAPDATASNQAPAAAPTPAASGSRTITVGTTGYSLAGRTSTGMPVGFGVVAVDPSVIPLGTRLTIPGYGEGVAADTGGSVRGSRIDLWFPTLAQARAWGRRTVTITLH